MSTTFEELSDEQKALCAWFVDEWQERGLSSPMPYSANEIANSLGVFASKKVSMATIRYGLDKALDAKKPSDADRWRYASSIIWKTHENETPLDEAIEQWRNIKWEESDDE